MTVGGTELRSLVWGLVQAAVFVLLARAAGAGLITFDFVADGGVGFRAHPRIAVLHTVVVFGFRREKETQLFFAEVQNKLLYAVAGKTAAELVVDRANFAEPNMALTTIQAKACSTHSLPAPAYSFTAVT